VVRRTFVPGVGQSRDIAVSCVLETSRKDASWYCTMMAALGVNANFFLHVFEKSIVLDNGVTNNMHGLCFNGV
jgi:hypothetical protein